MRGGGGNMILTLCWMCVVGHTWRWSCREVILASSKYMAGIPSTSYNVQEDYSHIKGRCNPVSAWLCSFWLAGLMSEAVAHILAVRKKSLKLKFKCIIFSFPFLPPTFSVQLCPNYFCNYICVCGSPLGAGDAEVTHGSQDPTLPTRTEHQWVSQ